MMKVNFFKIGDAVFVRNYGKGDAWVKGEVVEVLRIKKLQGWGSGFW